jgi:hypothetical protein
VVVSGGSAVSVPVGMVVGGGNSGAVGVDVAVLERSLSRGAVIVVVGDITTFESIKGGGDGVTETVGEGVAVRQGPGVLRLRYCGHSLSLMRISRSPPGRLSQISRFCVPSLWLGWVWLCWDVGLLTDVEGGDAELDVGEDTVTEDIAVGVTDGEGVLVGAGAIDGEGDTAAVGDDSGVIVGELVADGVGVLVCRVAGH